MSTSTRLKLRAVAELLRYDLTSALFGFRSAYRGLRPPVRSTDRRGAVESEIVQAIEWATTFYWKRVRCLQRSFAAVNLLRAYGIPAELVIGCQIAPFVGHAWVEVEGRVCSGAVALLSDLQILERA